MQTNTTTQLTPTQRIQQARTTIARMQAVCDEATPSPWRVGPGPQPSVLADDPQKAQDAVRICTPSYSYEDNHFISAARQWLPAWIADAYAALKQVERDALPVNPTGEYLLATLNNTDAYGLGKHDAALSTLTRIEATLAGMEGGG